MTSVCGCDTSLRGKLLHCSSHFQERKVAGITIAVHKMELIVTVDLQCEAYLLFDSESEQTFPDKNFQVSLTLGWEVAVLFRTEIVHCYAKMY